MITSINKPVGLTSHDVIDRVRQITGQSKVGHGGTLDPFAQGVLVVGIGRQSTKKLAQVLKNTDKEYLATIKLGLSSTTGDPEGKLTKVTYNQPTKAEVESALQQFLGTITQTPSPYSALKIQGTPAYKLARAGEKVDLPAREVTIYEIELIEYNPPVVIIRVLVSSGTYIRVLAQDIAKALGTSGYLTKLVRTKVGNYILKEAKEIEELGKQIGATRLPPDRRKPPVWQYSKSAHTTKPCFGYVHGL